MHYNKTRESNEADAEAEAEAGGENSSDKWLKYGKPNGRRVRRILTASGVGKCWEIPGEKAAKLRG